MLQRKLSSHSNRVFLSDIHIAEVKTDLNAFQVVDRYAFDENQYLFRNLGSGENPMQKRLIVGDFPVIHRTVNLYS